MIKFTKMHGLGNDYVYIDCTKNNKIADESKFAEFVSNRHFGIGSDGLVLIYKSSIADFKMRIFNSDGTEAQMCGNGIRCVGKYVYDKKLNLFTKENCVEEIEVDMGEPILEPERIPVISNKSIAKNILVNINNIKFYITCVSMGNPHGVVIVKDLQNFNVQKFGRLLETHNIFPDKANIEFVQIIDKNNIKMRVWERGTGETLACGTGACAAVVACNINNYVFTEVNVKLLAGNLKINWNKHNNHIYMRGGATTVFEGELI